MEKNIYLGGSILYNNLSTQKINITSYIFNNIELNNIDGETDFNELYKYKELKNILEFLKKLPIYYYYENKYCHCILYYTYFIKINNNILNINIYDNNGFRLIYNITYNILTLTLIIKFSYYNINKIINNIKFLNKYIINNNIFNKINTDALDNNIFYNININELLVLIINLLNILTYFYPTKNNEKKFELKANYNKLEEDLYALTTLDNNIKFSKSINKQINLLQNNLNNIKLELNNIKE
jgi:hypothetical protein